MAHFVRYIQVAVQGDICVRLESRYPQNKSFSSDRFSLLLLLSVSDKAMVFPSSSLAILSDVASGVGTGRMFTGLVSAGAAVQFLINAYIRTNI